MKLRLLHPLWTHLPSMAALAILIGALLSSGNMPAEAPVHFGPGGAPDRYGSPWAVFGLVIVLSAGFIILSIRLDELWARQERQKTFNHFSLLDELIVGAMTGHALGYLNLILQEQVLYAAPVREMLWLSLPAVAAALVLERLRPYTGQPERLDPEDATALRRVLARTTRSGLAFAYSDIQNPAYVSLLSLLLPAGIFVAAVLQAATMPVWSTLLLVLTSVLLASLYGGLRTSVTREYITIHVGTPGYRVLRLRPADVADVRLRPFMPLKEFGGYGVRANREMSAYYLSGGTGVLLTMRDGQKHLIGSNHPERLAAVIGAAAGLPAES